MVKKILMFGSGQCPDCMAMKERLEAQQIRYSFVDILDSLGKLKMFLKYRDALPEFEKVRAGGGIGIPFLLVNDGEWASLEGPTESVMARLKG